MNPPDHAFPSGEKETEAQYSKEPLHAGLTVRQYYKALIAPAVAETLPRLSIGKNPEYRETDTAGQFAFIARVAGELADALIAEDQEDAQKGIK